MSSVERSGRTVMGKDIPVPGKTKQDRETSEVFFHGPETPWRGRDMHNGETNYIVSSPQSDDREFAPGAHVKVTHPETLYTEDLYEHVNSVDATSDLQRTQIGEGSHGQLSLFGVRHRYPHVSWMSASPQFGAHIPTLLSVAAVETKNRFGQDLRSDTSLSESASPIVQRLAQAGAVQFPENESRNQIERGGRKVPTRNNNWSYGSEIPENTIRVGKQFLREALRRPKQDVTRASAALGEHLKGKQERMF